MNNDIDSNDEESREFKIYAIAAVVCLIGVALVVINGFTTQPAPPSTSSVPAISQVPDPLGSIANVPGLSQIPTVPNPIEDLSQTAGKAADVVNTGVDVLKTGAGTGKKVMDGAANFVDSFLRSPEPVGSSGNSNGQPQPNQ